MPGATPYSALDSIWLYEPSPRSPTVIPANAENGRRVITITNTRSIDRALRFISLPSFSFIVFYFDFATLIYNSNGLKTK